MARARFLFDFGSPNAYLSHRVLPGITERTGIAFEYVPVLLGGVFKATGNVSPAISLQGIKNKGEYTRLEMTRFLKRHGIDDFTSNPHFPVNTLQIMRGAVAAQGLDCFEAYVNAVFDHMWRVPRKMDDPAIVAEALAESGLPAEALLEASATPDVKARLIANTEAAVAEGVFGSPSFFVDDDHYFGKDSLRDVEEALRDGRRD